MEIERMTHMTDQEVLVKIVALINAIQNTERDLLAAITVLRLRVEALEEAQSK